MAEFQEVMRQARRMCGAHLDCDNCSMRDVIGTAGCPFLEAYIDRAKQIERIVMDWAATNPEPRYPSWKEWQDANFPKADVKVSPCAYETGKYFKCATHDCDSCRDQPIPADIAEKLGIKPIGGTEDEKARGIK